MKIRPGERSTRKISFLMASVLIVLPLLSGCRKKKKDDSGMVLGTYLIYRYPNLTYVSSGDVSVTTGICVNLNSAGAYNCSGQGGTSSSSPCTCMPPSG